MKYILFMILTVSSALANVQSGQPIKAIEFNNSKFTIGDIKSSILTPSEFATLHGNCWVQLNNSSVVDISITGSDLASLKSISSIKSSAGRVLRASGGLASALGTQQEDEYVSHTHAQNEHSHINGLPFANGWGLSRFGMGQLGSSGQVINPAPTSNLVQVGHITSPTAAINQYSGGNETRMKNLSVNMFIKINHQCN